MAYSSLKILSKLCSFTRTVFFISHILIICNNIMVLIWISDLLEFLQMMANLEVKEGKVNNHTRIAKINTNNDTCILERLPDTESRCALLGNIFCSQGEPGKVSTANSSHSYRRVVWNVLGSIYRVATNANDSSIISSHLLWIKRYMSLLWVKSCGAWISCIYFWRLKKPRFEKW